MYRSAVASWLARKQPNTARWLLRFGCQGCLRFFPNVRVEDHWLLRRLANDLGYRIPGNGRLRNGMEIRVPRNSGVGRVILSGSYYEVETVALLKRLLSPGRVFLDAGANVGQYTLVGSPLVGDTGTVHSFEPDPETF